LNTSLYLSLIYTFIYFLLNILFGLVILKLFFRSKWRSYSALTILTNGFLIGLSSFAAIWLILGLLGQFTVLAILSALAVIFLLSFFVWKDFLRLCKKIREIINSSWAELPFSWKILVILIAILMIFFSFGAILLPPLGDAEAYYMVLPKMMAETGVLKPQPNYYEFSKLGFIGEAHYAALMALANFHAAKFFVWLTTFAAIGSIISIGTNLNLKLKGQIIALAILLTSTTFTNYITDGKIDIFSASFGLAAYYWVLETKKRDLVSFILTGLFLGLAVVTKLSNIIGIIPGIAIIIIWNSYNNAKEIKSFWQEFLTKTAYNLFITFLFFGLATVPHLIKNSILFNNPLAISNKYENFQWSNPVWSPAAVTKATFVVKPPQTETVPTVSPLPVQIVGNVTEPKPSSKFEKILVFLKKSLSDFKKASAFLIKFSSYPIAFIYGERGGQGGNLSVLVLAFLPFLFFRSLNYYQKQVLLMFSLCLAIWIVVRAAAVTPRYILPTLLIFIPLVAAKTELILELKKNQFIKSLIWICLFVVILGTLASNLYMWQRFNWVFIKQTNPAALYGPHYPPLNFINNEAKKNDRVFLLGYYGFFLRGDLLANLDNEEEKMDIIFYLKPSPWEYLYERNFKYVIVQKAPHLVAEDYLIQNIETSQFKIKKIYSDPLTDIYSLEK